MIMTKENPDGQEHHPEPPPPSYNYPNQVPPIQTPYYPPSPPQPQMVPNAAQIGREYQAQLFARCAQGDHESTTKYGLCGIITAIICFPIGLIALFLDVERRCSRCGVRLD